jgi:hypothetical protein
MSKSINHSKIHPKFESILSFRQKIQAWDKVGYRWIRGLIPAHVFLALPE